MQSIKKKRSFTYFHRLTSRKIKWAKKASSKNVCLGYTISMKKRKNIDLYKLIKRMCIERYIIKLLIVCDSEPDRYNGWRYVCLHN